MALREYQRKRNFDRTPEPAGSVAAREASSSQGAGGGLFVIQKHAATRLHYDFRLELEGVLKSWAVPKGPSLDPRDKRLAVETEDHPLEYGAFEGRIPAGQYGAGTVQIWDRGKWFATEGPDAEAAYRQGRLKFTLQGEKLQGGWMLVRLPERPGERKENWLLIKERDESARPRDEYDIVEAQPQSVLSGLTIEELGHDERDPKPNNRHSKPKAKKKSPQAIQQGAETPRLDLARMTGARRAKLPDFVTPSLATLRRAVPEGNRWLHEIKLDGYRILGRISDAKVQLISRNNKDWTARMRSLVPACQSLPVRQALLDGEVVVFAGDGTTNFQSLQNALDGGETAHLVYCAFDLLYLDGFDLTRASLEDRKQLLEQLLSRSQTKGRIRYSDHIEGEGAQVFEQACAMGMEGIVSKRRDQPYHSGRHLYWIKTKCIQSDEFIVGGYTNPEGARTGFGSLLLGYFNKRGELAYAGRVGTGFSVQTLQELYGELKAFEIGSSPFKAGIKPPDSRRTHWVEPRIVAEVEYTAWTGDGVLRHARFRGVREDKTPSEIIYDVSNSPKSSGEEPVAESNLALPKRSEIRITNPDRLVYPEIGLTKLGVATYYAQVAEWILPHATERVLSVVRCPDGSAGKCFYQKHAIAGMPNAVKRVEVRELRKTEVYMAIEDVSGLMALAQFGVLEIHAWGSRIDNLERPDRLVFDLDPDPTVAWSKVRQAALDLRDFLDALGLVSFAKTTGGKGLHLVVPIVRRHSWDEVQEFTRRVAERFSETAQDAYTLKASKAARVGKIYIDHLRNARGATSIVPYSTRRNAEASVAVPIAWSEVPNLRGADQFTVGNLPRRLSTLRSDPWNEMAEVRQSITLAMRKKLR